MKKQEKQEKPQAQVGHDHVLVQERVVQEKVDRKQIDPEQIQIKIKDQGQSEYPPQIERQTEQRSQGQDDANAPDSVTDSGLKREEPVPAFLANYTPAQQSWLSDHLNVLAIIVLVLGIVVAIVVFR